ncbi:DMT family transporter [Malaciobacter molluscorum]|uniref:DMT family transporter n=1 Tax=Malaciobacter molluscorum TaxID=1032072 RepID=UPI001D193929|nr:DMT family transporter [Malaciobacter molluscorum]
MKTMIFNENKDSKDNKYYIFIFLAMVSWGIAWPASKAATMHSSPEIAAFWRYAISFISIIPILFYLKISFKADKIGIIYMFIAGILSAGFNYSTFLGLSYGQAGYGGTIMTSLAPIFTYFLSIIFLKNKVTLMQSIALFIGILATIILLKVPTEGIHFLNVNTAFFVISALCWAFMTILSKKSSAHVDPLLYTLIIFFITTIVNYIIAIPFHPFLIFNYDETFWLTILYVGLFSGTFSTTLFFVSIKKIGADKTATFMFIIPAVAILSSNLIYHEKILFSTILGCILSFLTVIIYNKRKVKQ